MCSNPGGYSYYFSALGKPSASLRCREAKATGPATPSKDTAAAAKGRSSRKKKRSGKTDTRCARMCHSLGAAKTHRHPAYREEPFLMKARYLVHVAYYQWLMDRNEFETNQERIRSSSRETYVRLKFMRVFPDERQLGADAVGLFMQDWHHPIEPALQRKMEKAARAYAASYCSAPTGPSVQSCREAVEKVTIAGALLTRMKEDPRMTVRDAYAAELAYRDSDDYQGPWMPGEVSTTPFNKAVATKRECRFT